MPEKNDKTEEKKEEQYQLKQVPTEFGLAIIDNEGNAMSMDQAITLLLNKVSEIEKLLK